MGTRMEPDEARSPAKDLQATIRNLIFILLMRSDYISSLQQQCEKLTIDLKT